MIPDAFTLAAVWTPTGGYPGRVSVALALQLLLTWRLAPIVGEGLVERIRRRRQPHPPGWSPSRGRRHGAGPTPPARPHTEQEDAVSDDLRKRFRFAISDPGAFLSREEGESVPNWSSRAVMAVRDEELRRAIRERDSLARRCAVRFEEIDRLLAVIEPWEQRADVAERRLAAIRELVPATPGGPGYRTCYDLAADIRRILDDHGGTP